MFTTRSRPTLFTRSQPWVPWGPNPGHRYAIQCLVPKLAWYLFYRRRELKRKVNLAHLVVEISTFSWSDRRAYRYAIGVLKMPCMLKLRNILV